ncbi:MAG: glycosyltransferase family 4 protein [Acidobacteriota bacterium]
MHVLQLGPCPPPEGGVSRNLLAIRDALIAGGDMCSVIATTSRSESHDKDGVYRPRSPIALLRLLRSLDYDLLHLHVGGSVSVRVLAMALACAVFGRGPAVLTLHSGAYPQTAEALSASRSSWRGMIFRRFAHVIAVNEELADVFRRYGVSSERLSVILPYVLSQPDESVAVSPELIEFYTLHSPVLLAVGGLEPDYDPLFQIAAMKEVLVQFPNAGLMIVGDGSIRDEVRKAAVESGYADRLCIAGNVEHAETLHLIRDADVLIRTTLFDGDAISIREALFLGIPAVATDNGMRPDAVHVFTPGDLGGFLAAINKALAQPAAQSEELLVEPGGIGAVCEIYGELLKQ